MTTTIKPYSKLNSRQRLVLINALKGMNQTNAYEAVYGHSSATYRCASELFNKPHFKAELERLQNSQLEAVNAQLLSKSEKRQILANFARAQLIDLIDDNGIPKIDKKSPAAKALKEWYRKERLDRDGNPIVTHSLKMLDPIAAIMEDNKMTGVYADKTKESSDNRVLNIIVVGGSDNLKNILAQVKERTKQLGMGDEE